jgi:hypothetical protein
MTLHINSLVFYTSRSKRSLAWRIVLLPITLIKALCISLQMFAYTVWSELIEAEIIVHAEKRDRDKNIH